LSIRSARLTIALSFVVATLLWRGAPAAAAQAFDHSTWDRLLSTYVDGDGHVAYRDLQAKDSATLEGYVRSLATARPGTWPQADQIAFWLDAYNAGIVRAILGGSTAEPAMGRVKLFKFWKFEVAGKRRTLDEIENQILRRNFAEPRIHFALVCASASCPRLRREAYTGDRLDAQLTEQERDFVNDPKRNVIDPERHTVRLSEIFRWYREDFDKAAGSVPKFLARGVADPKTRDWLLTGTYETKYLEYDWTLNAQPGQRLK
jgi:hypothetical protein